ncbi:hypothetical protein V8G54_016704 [Vigna mungo]|uniref:DNL-type domain-containing protein n=1 Tax=Vigna mungo TaxID=3915 RepID=A0AAQ3RY37_VIGMU
MAASALYSGTVFVPPLSHKTPKHVRSICFNPSISLPRSRFCAIVAAPSLSRRVFRVHGLMDNESGTAPKPESPNSETSASIDLNLPRRSLLVQFTCVCGERTKRLVNRLAYERGAVFVQVSIISCLFVILNVFGQNPSLLALQIVRVWNIIIGGNEADTLGKDQCAGCQQYHKLVDNLGLITEYDFREKRNIDSEN